MIYDFDKHIDRVNTHSAKWDSNPAYAKEVLPMWVADMDFQCPQPIVDAVQKRSQHPIYGYVHRTEDFQQVTCDWVKRRHGWGIKKEWVTFSPGVVPSVSAVIQMLTKPGEKVLIQRPVYYPFTNTINACGRTLVTSELILKDDKYFMDFEDMEKKLRDPEVKLFILCNPHNPVARVFNEDELRKIAKLCIDNGVVILSDEIHCDIIMSGYKHIPIASLSKEISMNTITLMSVTKTFNIAGLQVSNMITENEEFMKKFEAHLAMNTQNHINAFAFEAYLAAYTKCDDFIDQLCKYIEGNIKFAKKYIEENIPKLHTFEHQGTYLLWIDFKDLHMSDEELEKFCMEKIKVSMDGGYWFGEEGSGYMRMNMACPRKTVEEAMKRFKTAIDQLK